MNAVVLFAFGVVKVLEFWLWEVSLLLFAPVCVDGVCSRASAEWREPRFGRSISHRLNSGAAIAFRVLPSR